MPNQRGFSPLFIVLGVVVVLGLLGLAYYLGQMNKTTNTAPGVVVRTPIPTTAKPSPTASASASVNPTATPKPTATPEAQKTASPSATPN